MRQLNLEVSSFLSDPFHTFKNRLLPNDVILLRNIEEGHEELGGRGGGGNTSKDVQYKLEPQSNSTLSLPRPLGPVSSKTDAQDASGLNFR